MYSSTKIIELGSCAFRQPKAVSHCRFIHGYRLTAKFWFNATTLDDNNWVVDFGGLKKLKSTLQNQFDHTLCVSADDPYLHAFEKLKDMGAVDLRVMNGVGIEMFAEWCHGQADAYVNELTNGRCRCTKVELFEHENNSAIYERGLTSDTNSKTEHKQQPQQVKTQTEQIKPDTAVSVNSNERKLKNKWVDEKSTNVWGL